MLARNLRYHIAGREIDKAIADTINTDPESFWLKNNGLTIICDDFEIDGKEVKLRNFSIVNGGQTTYMLHKSTSINSDHDLFLPCKIIRIMGDTEDKKNAFSLSIAKATNSQKAIKSVDLKANSPEQVRFAQEMRQQGVFYQTKRGESVPSQYRNPYLNTDLVEIGKLCLSGIFQLPGKSRNKPSSLYEAKYYDPVFNGDQSQVSKLCKELLYIDYYFRNVFQREFDRENESGPDSGTRISFAHNARTICIAFVAFSGRFKQGNFTEQDLAPIINSRTNIESAADSLYDVFRELGNMQYLIAPQIFNDKDKYDCILKRLFNIIIEAGIMGYHFEAGYDNTLTPTNYLKRDKNYYNTLRTQWVRIKADFMRVFEEYGI